MGKSLSSSLFVTLLHYSDKKRLIFSLLLCISSTPLKGQIDFLHEVYLSSIDSFKIVWSDLPSEVHVLDPNAFLFQLIETSIRDRESLRVYKGSVRDSIFIEIVQFVNKALTYEPLPDSAIPTDYYFLVITYTRGSLLEYFTIGQFNSLYWAGLECRIPIDDTPKDFVAILRERLRFKK